MAENKKFNARIQLKNDISTNWDKATGFKPLPGEPIIVSDNKKKLKIGDGETLVKDLPYLLDAIPVVDGEGKKSIVIADGIASGDYSVAGGTTDGDVIKDLAGSLITPTLSEPEASGDMSLAFGANVKSTSIGTIALGYDSIAGVKGYYYHDIVFNDDGSAKIYLAKTQTLDAISTSSSAFKADLEAHLLLGSDTTVANLGWKAGDYISIVNDHKFPFCSQITNVAVESRTFKKSIIISTLTATVDCIVVTVDSLPFTAVDEPTIKLPDDKTIFAISRTWDETYKRYDVTLRNGAIELGWGALAIGSSNQALGSFSSATGYNNTAVGDFGSAEGRGTLAGYAAHSEGYKTEAKGTYSHAEGHGGKATGTGAHVEGIIQGTGQLSATGSGAHAEGLAQDGKVLMASGLASHAEGANTIASGSGSHAEGVNTVASNSQAHAEGRDTLASGNSSHAEGHNTQAIAQDAHAEGENTFAEGTGSHVEGYKTIASGAYAHAEGIGDKSDLENPLVSGGWKANVNLNPLEDLPLEGKINIQVRGGSASSSDWIMFSLSNISAGYTDSYTDEQGETHYLDYWNVEIYNKDTGWNITGLEFNGNAPKEFVNWLTKYFTASALELEGVLSDEWPPKGAITYITYSGGCASGYGAHSQNVNTIASGDAATSMGAFTQATANNAVSMGHTTEASGNAALAGGKMTVAKGHASLAFGFANAEGNITASGKGSIAMGDGLGKIEASGEGSVAIGLAQAEKTLTASGYGALALGVNTTASAAAATSTGSNTIASGGNSFATGHTTEAKGNAAFAEGRQSVAYGQTSHAEGYKTKAGTENGNVTYESAHAEGYETTAIDIGAHAEGKKTVASANYAHAEGGWTKATQPYAHSEGQETQANGKSSHAEGALSQTGGTYTINTLSPKADTTSGFAAHAEGNATIATGVASHAEGVLTFASAEASHVGGINSEATHIGSFVHGNYLRSAADYQVVFGQYNEENTEDLFTVGDGTSYSDRKNAFSVGKNADNIYYLNLNNNKMYEERFGELNADDLFYLQETTITTEGGMAILDDISPMPMSVNVSTDEDTTIYACENFINLPYLTPSGKEKYWEDGGLEVEWTSDENGVFSITRYPHGNPGFFWEISNLTLPAGKYRLSGVKREWISDTIEEYPDTYDKWDSLLLVRIYNSAEDNFGTHIAQFNDWGEGREFTLEKTQNVRVWMNFRLTKDDEEFSFKMKPIISSGESKMVSGTSVTFDSVYPNMTIYNESGLPMTIIYYKGYGLVDGIQTALEETKSIREQIEEDNTEMKSYVDNAINEAITIALNTAV